MCCALDLIHSCDHSCLCSRGLRLWIQALRSCNPRALHWWGTKCSSFASICVSVGKRSLEKLYYGDTSRDFLVEGNSCLMITSLLLCLSCALGHHVALEQPLNSCMPLHPIMSSVIRYFSCLKDNYLLGCLWVLPVKQLMSTFLMSTLSLDAVVQEKPRNMPVSLATRGPNDPYTGKRSQLVESEVYPIMFGRAVAAAFAAKRHVV